LSVREALTRTNILLAARLGDPTHPSVVAVGRARYANYLGEMRLAELRLELVEELPGPPDVLGWRLGALWPLARHRAEPELGTAALSVDVSRNPESWRMLLERVPVTAFTVTTTGGRVTPASPFWLLGRLNLLSHMAALVAQGLVRVARPREPGPTVWDVDRTREALASARTPPPPTERDAYLTETTTMDDAALAMALCCWWTQYRPSAELDLGERPVRLAEGGF
jgi:hypothetical protein